MSRHTDISPLNDLLSTSTLIQSLKDEIALLRAENARILEDMSRLNLFMQRAESSLQGDELTMAEAIDYLNKKHGNTWKDSRAVIRQLQALFEEGRDYTVNRAESGKVISYSIQVATLDKFEKKGKNLSPKEKTKTREQAAREMFATRNRKAS